MRNILRGASIINIGALLVTLVLPFLFPGSAQAAGLQQAYVRLDRLADGATTGGMVCAKSATASVETTVKVTFPSGFATVDTAANWTVTTTNIPADATAWIGIGTASAASGQDVTFPSGDMVVGTLYCFNFSETNTLTNAGAGNNLVGSVTTQLAGPTTIDTSNFALSIVTDDQIVVSATVPATFSFALSGNTDAFTTNLSSSAVVSTSGRTVTIGTNAASGWVAWVKSANAALNSVSTSATIATTGTVNNTPDNLNPTTGYLLDVDITTDNGTGTGTVSQASNYGAEYNGTTTEEGGTLSTSFQPIAACSGTTAGDVLTLTERAFISAVQAAAADYTDTLTVVGAGRF
ncbi:MAG: hypothetical protein KBD19_04035 [Candidatus Moranbacteria bacterium]|jgi:hypothetical protein|nr:hypothetical protein [Candidatus Moranbacteria bacterium]